jgi:diguanylate cyclase
MLDMDLALLRKTLEQLEQAAHDHAHWHENLLRAIVCHLPCDPSDLEENAHRRCRFGQWYYEQAPAALWEEPAFAAIEAEHKRLHRVAAQLLRESAADIPIPREDYDDLVAGGERLHLELDSLRHEVAGALRNRDALTGAYGRAEILPALREWRELARRDVQHCCVAFMDLDHLKEINDTHGHAAGDQVLAGVVRYATQHLRPYDKVFRYGGDEFLISLPGADLAAGQAVIEHIRNGLASTDRCQPGRQSNSRYGFVRSRIAGTRCQRRGIHRSGGQGLARRKDGWAKSCGQLGSSGHDRHDAATRAGGRRRG